MPQQIYFWDDTWAIPETAPLPATPNLTAYINNFKAKGFRTDRLQNSAYFDAGNRINTTVFISKKAIQELLGIAPNELPHAEIVGIILRFGWNAISGSVVLLARSSDGNFMRPPNYEGINFQNPDIPVDDGDYDDLFSNGFKANGYAALIGLVDGATLSVDFRNSILFQLIHPLTPIPATLNNTFTKMHVVLAPPNEDELVSGPWLNIIAENHLGTQWRVGEPCPPKCY